MFYDVTLKMRDGSTIEHIGVDGDFVCSMVGDRIYDEDWSKFTISAREEEN